METELQERGIGDGKVLTLQKGWRLEMPAGDRQTYRLAQVDNYAGRERKNFLHRAPWEMRLRARASETDLPGTWGFGLWNDPFGLSIGFGGRKKQLPALPQVAWFMHASRPNWLALRDGPVDGSGREAPPNGFFAGTLRSRPIASGWFVPGIPTLPLFALRPFSRWVRRFTSRRLIRQVGVGIDVDVRQWHEYCLQWEEDGCSFRVDEKEILSTPISPLPPLGLVIWIDNQFAAWTPEGRIGYGTLENPLAWMDVEELRIS